MATSNPTPNAGEFKVYDFFCSSPEPNMDDLKQQLYVVDVEVEGVKTQLRTMKAQLNHAVEESMMVSEAHLELKLEEMVEELQDKLKEQMGIDVGMRVKVEMAFASLFVLFVSIAGALFLQAFGFGH